MDLITKTINITNTGSISDNVKATFTIPDSVSIQSFSTQTGSLSGNVWTIVKMYDGETVSANITLLVPDNFKGVLKVEVFGSISEIDISDNTSTTSISTSNDAYCAPPSADCGQPTVSLLESFTFGMITGNMAVNSCLSTKCLHRFSVSDLVNVNSNEIEYNKTTGSYSLQPSNPFLPWSFDFRVKSYDCTVTIKGKTQFEADGPKTISGPALYTTEEMQDFIVKDLPVYADRLTADADIELITDAWFLVKDDTYADQATLNIKL